MLPCGHVDRNSTKEDLVEKLEGAFPKLRGIPFEMFQAIGVGGGTGKSLRRLSSQHAVLSVPMILQSRIFSIIYLKPESNIVQVGNSRLLGAKHSSKPFDPKNEF